MDLKAAAETRGDMTRCYICVNWFSAIHWHHTVPRSLGGHDDLQIPLCGSCHTSLHAKASAMFAILRGKRKGQALKRYWADPDSESRAERWLRILVGAMQYPPVESQDKTTVLPALTVDQERRYNLEIIKRDANLTSISQALLFCIDFTASYKGLDNNDQKNKSGNQQKAARQQGNHRRDLW